MERDFVIEVMLESAILAAGIPLVEDCFNLIRDALLAFGLLVWIE
jgi:hypothetical protein